MSKYHDILGVAADASEGDVKKAYRKLASQHHPDKGGDEAKFKEVKEAYERITSPEKFANENQHQHYREYQGHSDPFWDQVKVHINRHGFNRGGFEDHLRRQQQNIRMQFELSLESTLHDQTREIHIPEYNIPPMEITIPAGIRHGEAVQYANIPQDANSYAQRALIVQFVIAPHPDFVVANHVHLITHGRITALDAMVGTTLNVKTLEGGTLAVKVPAGSENGTKLKIPAKGLKYKEDPTYRGDLYVEIDISIPKLTDEEIEIITKLRDKRQNEPSK